MALDLFQALKWRQEPQFSGSTRRNVDPASFPRVRESKLAGRTAKRRGERKRAAAATNAVLTPSPSSQVHVGRVAPLVFFSGCAAFVFQIAWMRELRLVFGATTAAVAAVLAIFMAGLGVGSPFLGRRADRVANPLFFYGALEVAIALSVAVSPWLMSLASSDLHRPGRAGIARVGRSDD